MKLKRMRGQIAAVVILAASTLALTLPASAAESFASLVAGIEAANRGAGASEITLTSDITLSDALPLITGEVTIEGNGFTLSGDFKFRIFDVLGGRLILKNLTVTEGTAGVDDAGGAIRMRNSAWVTIMDSSFISNIGEDGGAVSMDYGSLNISNSSFSGNKVDREGAVIVAYRGTITINDSSFVDNVAGSWGGAIGAQFSRIRISNSTFHNNRAVTGWGGALYVRDTDMTLTHLTMIDNRAKVGGDAISITDGTVRLRNSIVAGGGNAADCIGGLAQNVGNLSTDGTCGVGTSDEPRLDSLTGSSGWLLPLDGSPAVDAADRAYCLDSDQIGTVRPQGGACDIGAIEARAAIPAVPTAVPPLVCTLAERIIAANTDRPAGACPAGKGADTIEIDEDITLWAALPDIESEIIFEGNGHTISGNGQFRVFSFAGGRLTINDLTLAEGKAADDKGGAIILHGAGTVTINDSRFLNNSAREGGAISALASGIELQIDGSHFEGNQADFAGGAIMMTGGGSANIRNSSFVGNAVTLGDRSGGGAIDVTNANRTEISNSSFIKNRAPRGGAITAGYGVSTLTHVTMFNNHAITGDGIAMHKPFDDGKPTEFRLRNSIIVGSRESAQDCEGKLAQNIGNFIADGSCSPAFSGDPMLAESNETTAYVSPLAGSPAIDAANPSFCPERDQIGKPRPLGGGCDIGAIEVMPAPVTLSSCLVTATHNLIFRDNPKGERIGSIPHDTSLPAAARTTGWFNVEYNGASGWISADYVVFEGDCS